MYREIAPGRFAQLGSGETGERDTSSAAAAGGSGQARQRAVG